ncbi:MAG: c-type cytochrome biogenesis protein CcmI [Rhodocyclaceae bacterium]
MTAFWIAAGVLLVLALLFVLPPLMRAPRPTSAASRKEANIAIYRNQMRELEDDLSAGTLSRDQYAQSRAELESRVLEDAAQAEPETATPASKRNAWAGLAVGMSLPIVAVALYLVLGNPMGADFTPGPEQAGAPQQVTPEDVLRMVETLANRLKESPNNPEGWTMLARSYAALERYPDAAKAYEQAAAQNPGDAQLLADYADALAMAQGRNLTGKPAELIQAALKVDPNNIKALALAGSLSFEAMKYADAVAQWEKAASLVPPDSEFARGIAGSIAEARQKGGLATPAAASPAAATSAPAPTSAATQSAANPANAATIVGTVQIAPALANKVGPADTIFVFARAASGPKMPLAVAKLEAKNLPGGFVLDDSMAMTSELKLSSFPEIVVGARLSKSGNATPQPGDMESALQTVKPGAGSVALVIDKAIN